jgi:hypothetical protein
MAQQAARPGAGGGTYLDTGAAQQKVWEKVAEKNRRFKAAPSSGTYRAVANLEGGDAQRSIAPYVKALSGVPGRDPQIVGVIAAVNSEVIAADIFGDPTLFRKLWPKLLRAYAADAAENPPGKNKRIPAVTARKGKDFYLGAMDGHSKMVNKTESATALRLESRSAVLYRLAPQKGGAAAAGALHENLLKK